MSQVSQYPHIHPSCGHGTYLWLSLQYCWCLHIFIFYLSLHSYCNHIYYPKNGNHKKNHKHCYATYFRVHNFYSILFQLENSYSFFIFIQSFFYIAEVFSSLHDNNMNMPNTTIMPTYPKNPIPSTKVIFYLSSNYNIYKHRYLQNP